MDEPSSPSPGSTLLYCSGGFEELIKTVLIKQCSLTPVADLESTQQKADTTVILHAVYRIQKEGMKGREPVAPFSGEI